MSALLTALAGSLPWQLATGEATPPPVEPDPVLVTPGVIGFLITGVFFIAVILLVIDMSRRIRRVRYREEARERIAAELDAGLESGLDTAGNAGGVAEHGAGSSAGRAADPSLLAEPQPDPKVSGSRDAKDEPKK